jgi:hypothetical protein
MSKNPVAQIPRPQAKSSDKNENRQSSWLLYDEPMADASKLLIGSREWVALPGLGLNSIKAKIDTGAKTSALHAFRIEIFVDRGKRYARFFVHPAQRRSDLVVECVAPLVDQRVVSDSGGHRERRWVIEAEFVAGSIAQKIEVTLANRETMSCRMLLGRSALKHFLIDPSRSFMLGRPANALKQKKTVLPKPALTAKKARRKT